jgi:hypothetical protein
MCGPFAAAVLNQLYVIAPGVKQGVSKNGKPGVVQRAFWHLAVCIDGLGNAAVVGVVGVVAVVAVVAAGAFDGCLDRWDCCWWLFANLRPVKKALG